MPLVGARDQQQILGETDEPLGLLGGRTQRGLELVVRARPPQRDLELGTQERERRPQLVRRVGDESSLVLERGFESREHLVQRDGERRELVAWPRGQAAAARRRSGDRRRAAAHRLDGAQRGGRKQRSRRAASSSEQRPAPRCRNSRTRW